MERTAPATLRQESCKWGAHRGRCTIHAWPLYKVRMGCMYVRALLNCMRPRGLLSQSCRRVAGDVWRNVWHAWGWQSGGVTAAAPDTVRCVLYALKLACLVCRAKARPGCGRAACMYGDNVARGSVPSDEDVVGFSEPAPSRSCECTPRCGRTLHAGTPEPRAVFSYFLGVVVELIWPAEEVGGPWEQQEWLRQVLQDVSHHLARFPRVAMLLGDLAAACRRRRCGRLYAVVAIASRCCAGSTEEHACSP